MLCLPQSSRRPREERDVSQCESVASTVSAQEDEDIEASNEEENPEDSEGNFSGKETRVCTERSPCFVLMMCSESCVPLNDIVVVPMLFQLDFSNLNTLKWMQHF